jgi:hypothetical protein
VQATGENLGVLLRAESQDCGGFGPAAFGLEQPYAGLGARLR